MLCPTTRNWHSTLESQGFEHVQGLILDKILSTSQQSQVLGQQQPRRRQVQLAQPGPIICGWSRGAVDTLQPCHACLTVLLANNPEGPVPTCRC